MSESIFNSAVRATLESFYQPAAAQAQRLTGLSISAFTYGLIGLAVVAFEAHIVYATFEFLFGHDDGVWQPWVMAFASLILVLAVHFMAHKNADHPIVKTINHLSGALIPVYLIGIGSLIVVSLYNGGLSDLLAASEVDLSFDDFGVDESGSDDWFAVLMQDIISPIAGFLFSAGIGSLTIISVFVAHYALSKSETLFAEAIEIHKTVQADRHDLNQYKNAWRDYEAVQHRLEDMVIDDEEAIRQSLADDTLLTIQRSLEPTLNFIQKEKAKPHPIGLEMPNQVDVQALEKAIKPIQSINRNDILKHLK